MTDQNQVLNPNEANMPQQNLGVNPNFVINQNVVVGGGTERKKSIGAGVSWMIGLLMFLFWLPLVGAFIAGFVGGRKAGSVGSALISVAFIAVAMPIILIVMGASLASIPILGAIIGASGFLFFFAEITPLLIGALVGGATAD